MSKYSEYINITYMMDQLGVTVVYDLEEIDESPWTEPCEVCALGQRGELEAGLRRFTITPYFRSLDKLEEYCCEYRNRVPNNDKIDDFVIPDGLMEEWSKYQ